MAKSRKKKARKVLAARQRIWDALPEFRKHGTTRPGSLSGRKQA